MTTPDQSPTGTQDPALGDEAGDQPAEGATSRQTNEADQKGQAEGER